MKLKSVCTIPAQDLPASEPHSSVLPFSSRCVSADMCGVPSNQSVGMVDCRVLLLRERRVTAVRACHCTGRVPVTRFTLRSADLSDVSALQLEGRVPENLGGEGGKGAQSHVSHVHHVSHVSHRSHAHIVSHVSHVSRASCETCGRVIEWNS